MSLYALRSILTVEFLFFSLWVVVRSVKKAWPGLRATLCLKMLWLLHGKTTYKRGKLSKGLLVKTPRALSLIFLLCKFSFFLPCFHKYAKNVGKKNPTTQTCIVSNNIKNYLSVFVVLILGPVVGYFM